MDRLAALLGFYEEDPADAFTRFALAQEYARRGEAEEALRFYRGLVEEQPEYVGTYYHLGKLYETLGRKPEAIDTYQQGIRRAREQRDLKNLSELQDALLHAQGIGFEDDDQ